MGWRLDIACRLIVNIMYFCSDCMMEYLVLCGEVQCSRMTSTLFLCLAHHFLQSGMGFPWRQMGGRPSICQRLFLGNDIVGDERNIRSNRRIPIDCCRLLCVGSPCSKVVSMERRRQLTVSSPSPAILITPPPPC